MKNPTLHFGDVLRVYMKRIGETPDALAAQTIRTFGEFGGVPKSSIVRWIKGGVRTGPRDWTPIVKIGVVMGLNEADLSDLLKVAGFPPLSILASQADDRALKPYLLNWKKMVLEAPIPKVAIYLNQVQAPPGDFTGRESEMRQILNPIKRGQFRSVGIFGPAGIGKTTLGQKLAESLIDHYDDAQIYLDLRGASTENPPSMMEILAYIIQSFGYTFNPPKSETEVKKLMPSVMAKYHSILRGKKGILFLDNATNAQQIKQLVPPPDWLLVFTSRQRFDLPDMFEVELDVFTRTEAEKFLHKKSPRIKTHAADIARLCGYLPLALRLAGSALNVHEDITPEEYLTLLKDERQRLEVLDASSEITGEPGIVSSLDLSFKLLHVSSSRLWTLLSMFPNTFDLSAAAQIWQLDLSASQKLLSNLVEFSLVEFSQTSRRYNLHSLARLYASDHLRKKDRFSAQKRLSQHYISVLNALTQQYRQGREGAISALRIFELEWPNIQLGQSWAAINSRKNKIATQLCLKYPLEGTELFYVYLKPTDQMKWYKAGLASAKLLKDRLAEGKLLRNLGEAFADTSDQKKAVAYLQKALVIFRRFGDDSNEAKTLNGLGSVFKNIGDARQSIKLHKQARKIFKKIGDAKAEGAVIGNLGILFSNTGKLKLAVAYYECQLTITREVGDRLREGNCLNNLGLAYIRLGKPQNAIAIFDETLKIRRELHDRRGEAQTLNNLGWALSDLKDYAKSRAIYTDILPISRELEDRQLESNIIGNIANNHFFEGQYRSAIESYEQQLKLATEIGYPPGIGNALSNMGAAYLELGEISEAKKLVSEACAVHRKADNLQGEGDALLTLADVYSRSEEHPHAAKLIRQALGNYLKVGNRSDLMTALRQLLEVCAKISKRAQMMPYVREGRRISEKLKADKLIESFKKLAIN